jgi:acyl carrier protein
MGASDIQHPMPLSHTAEITPVRLPVPKSVREVTADQVAERDRILEGLVTFVVHTFMVEAPAIDLDKSLIDQGIIDSFGLIEITTFIDDAFGTKIQEKDMTREAFGSMRKMATFVSRRGRGEI